MQAWHILLDMALFPHWQAEGYGLNDSALEQSSWMGSHRSSLRGAVKPVNQPVMGSWLPHSPAVSHFLMDLASS
jgi:hypothetical protein